ncbi:MAG: membrane protein required for colicin V production [Parasphingorhabdus sp.]|jgi:membrane protein required for colicin V production
MNISEYGLSSFDLLLIAVFVISAIVGMVRGLIRELLSLLSWVVSLWLAFKFAPIVSNWLKPYLDAPQLQYIVALVAVFIVCLLVFSLCAILLAKLLSLVGIAGTDRSLGAIFGIARGIAIGLILVFLLRFTPAKEETWFETSRLVPYFDPILAILDRQGYTSVNSAEIILPTLNSN